MRLQVVQSDVTATPADVLLLKYAQSFYGADEAVAVRLMQQGQYGEDDLTPKVGEHRLVNSHGAITASQVLLQGTPRLREFRYKEMRQFARRAIEILKREQSDVQSITTTVHGAGYGLDIEESLRSMLLGFQQGLTTHPLTRLQSIVFVERNARRFSILQNALSDIELVLPTTHSGSSH